MGRGTSTRTRLQVTTRAVVTVSAVVAAAIAVVAASLLSPRAGARAPAPARPVVVRAAFEPTAVEFGDVVTARVVVTLDTDVVRPSTAHVVFDIAPLTQLGRARLSNSEQGGVAIRVYEVRAACLSDACLNESGRRAVNPGTVHVD